MIALVLIGILFLAAPVGAAVEYGPKLGLALFAGEAIFYVWLFSIAR